MKNPFAFFAVTTLPLVVTVCPLSDEAVPCPWICMIEIGGNVTVNAIGAVDEPACASVIVAVSALVPEATAPTVAVYEYTLSPAAASPLLPSSRNACFAEPPIGDRSATTPMPVLAGLVPG